MKTASKSTRVSDCSFVGVQYSPAHAQAVTVIAEALRVNADALASLARVLVASNLTIECMLKVETEKQ